MFDWVLNMPLTSTHPEISLFSLSTKFAHLFISVFRQIKGIRNKKLHIGTFSTQGCINKSVEYYPQKFDSPGKFDSRGIIHVIFFLKNNSYLDFLQKQ